MSAVTPLQSLPLIRLPEPWKTTYEIHVALASEKWNILGLRLSEDQVPSSKLPPEPLHNPSLSFSDLVYDQIAPTPSGDNTPWARFSRQFISYAAWDGGEVPSVGRIWNLVHALVSMHPELEGFRLGLSGERSRKVAEALQATGLATPAPNPSRPEHKEINSKYLQIGISRAAFWQGAASPFGPRPVWVAHPDIYHNLPQPLTSFPQFAHQHTVTFSTEGNPVHAQHPIRPSKPCRGSTVYSRYIPHLDEFFSMVQLDFNNENHVHLFHIWQNDPRVSQGWNQTGTLDEHREYLQKIDEDPHQMAVLAKFDDICFAYFEIYWAKEDHMGVYLQPSAGDYDRGRHSLVGDSRYRGPHRASAWWASLVHYLYLDDSRTMCVVGEPKATNANVLAHDAANGFHVEKLADLPHKRSAIVRSERVRFFQIVGFGSTGAGSGFKASAGNGRKILKAEETRERASMAKL